MNVGNNAPRPFTAASRRTRRYWRRVATKAEPNGLHPAGQLPLIAVSESQGQRHDCAVHSLTEFRAASGKMAMRR